MKNSIEELKEMDYKVVPTLHNLSWFWCNDTEAELSEGKFPDAESAWAACQLYVEGKQHDQFWDDVMQMSKCDSYHE